MRGFATEIQTVFAHNAITTPRVFMLLEMALTSRYTLCRVVYAKTLGNNMKMIEV